MSLRILTSCIININTFMSNPHKILKNSKENIIAIFIENTLAFYVISTQRLTELIDAEARMLNQICDVVLDKQLYEEPINNNIHNIIDIPIGKFAMYPGWKPDINLQQIAALWGIYLTKPVTSEELAAFIAYWQVENKVFHHIQWQQKLARNVQISRANNKRSEQLNYDTDISESNSQIPIGFRG